MLKIEWKAMADDLYRERYILPLIILLGCFAVGAAYRDGNGLADFLESAWIALPIVVAIFFAVRITWYLATGRIRWERGEQ